MARFVQGGQQESAGVGDHADQTHGGKPDRLSAGIGHQAWNICIPTWRRWSACELIRDLRLGEFDVLVGINLLREGLDMPEVALVAILDADKEGFLRSETSPDPDHRPGGPKCGRPGHHVRRRHHRFHAQSHRGDQPPPGDSAAIQSRNTASRPRRCAPPCGN